MVAEANVGHSGSGISQPTWLREESRNVVGVKNG
jgi:hypothetical protein